MDNMKQIMYNNPNNLQFLVEEKNLNIQNNGWNFSTLFAMGSFHTLIYF